MGGREASVTSTSDNLIRRDKKTDTHSLGGRGGLE